MHNVTLELKSSAYLYRELEGNTQTDRFIDGHVGQQDAEESAPGGSDQQRGDEDSCRNGQAVRPAGQEEVGQGEEAEGQWIIGAWEREGKTSRGAESNTGVDKL